MTETDSQDTKGIVFNFLIELGCCKRCALRFVGDSNTNYDNPTDDVKKLTRKDLGQNSNDENVFKKSKPNPCIICLDLLQDTTLQTMILNPELEKVLEYDSDTFVNYVSLPKAVLIREHSMEICVKEKFPQFFKDRNVIALNRAWSLSIQNKLAQRLEKKYDKNSYLQIQFNTSYVLDKEESLVMLLLEDKSRKHSIQHDPLSCKNVTSSLQTINSELFKQKVSIPPATPTKALDVEQVFYKHDHVFIAGRYCKYARNMFQTPWSGDDIQVEISSVQEKIFDHIENSFSAMVFSSSGREDFDVRTLGRGRPFFIKICDPKRTKVSFEKFRQIEQAVKHTKVVEVRDLQFIDRRYLSNIKEGEQFKKKTYRALCIVDKPENLTAYIDKINNISAVTLQQKTPLRVYHRRSSDIRERQIYSLKAKVINGKKNLLELDMITQAGTYIKEFVHGDLGRTTPSLCEIVGGYIDIIALDVLDIHLDFPPSINHKVKNHQTVNY
ncbi:putative tRNA pseudouridine synthase Pus10 isoform X2 [Zophobas morio]|uniref:putative tRNA pseudouridine synthase Pus10 isoform X2 n=1 Tax=Zophobas morio TaxID=2755281 RepID=UPI003082B238